MSEIDASGAPQDRATDFADDKAFASTAPVDIAICGGGPAGLALAIRAARAGFRTLLLERTAGAPDKACGEGLMPPGVRALEALGALGRIPSSSRMPFAGIRYVLESGRSIDARFRRGNGLGIRRTALANALRETALEAGVRLERATVRGYRKGDRCVHIISDRGVVSARLLVGADGLQSPLRKLAGLENFRAEATAKDPSHLRRRFGLRRHFHCAPWSDLVEVHWSEGAECYVTPVGPALVNIAFLWEPDRGVAEEKSGERFASLLARFPRVAEHLEGISSASESRGSGPLLRETTGRAADRLALVGDAAGYVDAVTGQGLSLAFLGAEALVAALPKALDDDAELSLALKRYDRSLHRAWLRYAIPARVLLALAHRPNLRKAALGLVARAPRMFSRIVESIAAG